MWSGLSGDKIHELAQLSLLDERAGRFGFRDLASARQIAKLLADGVRLWEIIRSVNEIRKWPPDIGLGSVRLYPGPGDSLEVEQAGARTDKRGQFMLAVVTVGTIPMICLRALKRLSKPETLSKPNGFTAC